MKRPRLVDLVDMVLMVFVVVVFAATWMGAL